EGRAERGWGERETTSSTPARWPKGRPWPALRKLAAFSARHPRGACPIINPPALTTPPTAPARPAVTVPPPQGVLPAMLRSRCCYCILCSLIGLTLAVLLLFGGPPAARAQAPKGPVSFINDVAPILKENCF